MQFELCGVASDVSKSVCPFSKAADPNATQEGLFGLTPSSAALRGVDGSFAVGFAFGAASFGTFELIKRTLPEASAQAP